MLHVQRGRSSRLEKFEMLVHNFTHRDIFTGVIYHTVIHYNIRLCTIFMIIVTMMMTMTTIKFLHRQLMNCSARI